MPLFILIMRILLRVRPFNLPLIFILILLIFEKILFLNKEKTSFINLKKKLCRLKNFNWVAINWESIFEEFGLEIAVNNIFIPE